MQKVARHINININKSYILNGFENIFVDLDVLVFPILERDKQLSKSYSIYSKDNDSADYFGYSYTDGILTTIHP